MMASPALTISSILSLSPPIHRRVPTGTYQPPQPKYCRQPMMARQHKVLYTAIVAEIAGEKAVCMPDHHYHVSHQCLEVAIDTNVERERKSERTVALRSSGHGLFQADHTQTIWCIPGHSLAILKLRVLSDGKVQGACNRNNQIRQQKTWLYDPHQANLCIQGLIALMDKLVATSKQT